MAKLPLSFRNKIIQALRKISLSWAPRVRVKNRQKRGPALWECANCGQYVYDGTSQKSLDKIKEEHPDTIMDKVYMDHIEPVVAIGCESDSFDLYIERLFCEESNWQLLCRKCHDIKTELENIQRKEYAKPPYKK